MGKVLSAILVLGYVFVILPVGGLMKLLGIDLLGRRFSKDAPSYWQSRDAAEHDQEYYERQL